MLEHPKSKVLGPWCWEKVLLNVVISGVVSVLHWLYWYTCFPEHIYQKSHFYVIVWWWFWWRVVAGHRKWLSSDVYNFHAPQYWRIWIHCNRHSQTQLKTCNAWKYASKRSITSCQTFHTKPRSRNWSKSCYCILKAFCFGKPWHFGIFLGCISCLLRVISFPSNNWTDSARLSGSNHQDDEQVLFFSVERPRFLLCFATQETSCTGGTNNSSFECCGQYLFVLGKQIAVSGRQQTELWYTR